MDDWQISEISNIRIHRTAIVEPWVSLGFDSVVHPYAILGRLPDKSQALARQPEQIKYLQLGARSVIGCHTVIYGNVELGDDCFLGDYSSIREGSRIGEKCVIGRQVSINYNVKIGNECRFQDGTHITGDTHIGNNCFFGVGVITSNDRRVDLDNYHFPNPPQPCLFGSKILVGSGANILAGVIVGDNSVIGAGAVVTRNVTKGSLVLGPAASVKEICDGHRLWALTK